MSLVNLKQFVWIFIDTVNNAWMPVICTEITFETMIYWKIFCIKISAENVNGTWPATAAPYPQAKTLF